MIQFHIFSSIGNMVYMRRNKTVRLPQLTLRKTKKHNNEFLLQPLAPLSMSAFHGRGNMDGKGRASAWMMCITTLGTVSCLSLALCTASFSQKGCPLIRSNKRSSLHVIALLFAYFCVRFHFLLITYTSYPSHIS